MQVLEVWPVSMLGMYVPAAQGVQVLEVDPVDEE